VGLLAMLAKVVAIAASRVTRDGMEVIRFVAPLRLASCRQVGQSPAFMYETDGKTAVNVRKQKVKTKYDRISVIIDAPDDELIGFAGTH
jgi:hypothetical protein